MILHAFKIVSSCPSVGQGNGSSQEQNNITYCLSDAKNLLMRIKLLCPQGVLTGRKQVIDHFRTNLSSLTLTSINLFKLCHPSNGTQTLCMQTYLND